MISASPGEFHNKQQQINMRCGKCDRSLFDSKSSQSFGQELCKGFGPWCLWWLVEGSVASVWCLVANTKRRLGKALEFRKSHNIGFCWLSNCLLGGSLDLPWLGWWMCTASGFSLALNQARVKHLCKSASCPLEMILTGISIELQIILILAQASVREERVSPQLIWRTDWNEKHEIMQQV